MNFSAPEAPIDLLVIGSGAGGLSAAVTAAHQGLKVLVLEKEKLFGGTTAWSGGWMWIPHNPLARAAGIEEDLSKPLSYLRHELGAQFDEAVARHYLQHAPQMVAFFQANTALQFIDGNGMPDFHGRTPDAALGGRSVCAAPMDGSKLGPQLKRLKPPLYETTLWGMGIASGTDLRHFLNAMRSLPSFAYVTRRVLRHCWHLLTHQRGLHLVNGNALVAGLAASAFAKGVEIRTGTSAKRLLTQEGRVVGAVVQTGRGEQHIFARRGVVLACGGFPHDAARKQQLLAHAPTGQEHWSAAAWGNTGDGLRLAEGVGGQVATGLAQAAALAPVSLVPQKRGGFAHFAHLIERAKPGLMAVLPDGRRFVNEADSYCDFASAMLKATPAGQLPQAWLVCDHAFIRHYGLGAVKPAPMPMGAWLRNGYLKTGRNLVELAQACDIDANALAQTAQRYNAMATVGKDDDFAKGETPYNRIQGDAAAGHLNPCMAALGRLGTLGGGPFYAVRVVTGSLGTFAGLHTNLNAQVLDGQNKAIPGLYAAGNDMNSILRGHYPSGGITLGPAMTFGHLAALHAAGPTRPV